MANLDQLVEDPSALSVLQATLTLPGIAGLILTLAMAVDANVLIYERMRDEANGGRSAIAAARRRLPRPAGAMTRSSPTLCASAPSREKKICAICGICGSGIGQRQFLPGLQR